MKLFVVALAHLTYVPKAFVRVNSILDHEVFIFHEYLVSSILANRSCDASQATQWRMNLHAGGLGDAAAQCPPPFHVRLESEALSAALYEALHWPRVRALSLLLLAPQRE